MIKTVATLFGRFLLKYVTIWAGKVVAFSERCIIRASFTTNLVISVVRVTIRAGGFTGGYQLGLNSNLSLDFHAGVGYTYADYDEYTLINKVRVRKDCKTKKYWGINQLGITLIWKLLK